MSRVRLASAHLRLKKKRGLEIISDKHAGGERIYRLAAPAEVSVKTD